MSNVRRRDRPIWRQSEQLLPCNLSLYLCITFNSLFCLQKVRTACNWVCLFSIHYSLLQMFLMSPHTRCNCDTVMGIQPLHRQWSWWWGRNDDPACSLAAHIVFYGSGAINALAPTAQLYPHSGCVVQGMHEVGALGCMTSPPSQIEGVRTLRPIFSWALPTAIVSSARNFWEK